MPSLRLLLVCTMEDTDGYCAGLGYGYSGLGFARYGGYGLGYGGYGLGYGRTIYDYAVAVMQAKAQKQSKFYSVPPSGEEY